MPIKKQKRFTFKTPALPEHNLKTLPLPESPPEDRFLISWSSWYLKKEVIGIGSPYTAEAKIQDLQKFINYFYHHNPDGSIKSWDKPLTYGFIEKLGEIYEVSSIRRIMATLSHIAKFFERCRVIEYDDNPVRGVRLPVSQPSSPKQLMAVADDEVIMEGKAVFEKLLETAKSMVNEKKTKKHWPYRDVAIISVLYYAGLRVTELCSLVMSQIEKEHKTGGIVFRGVKCKGNKIRDVYLRDIGAKALNEYLKNERGVEPGPLFTTYNRKRLSRFGVWSIIKKIEVKASMSMDTIAKIEAHPHRFRHMYAYNLQKAGFSESEIKEELGHSSMRYVGVYTRPSEQERFKRLKKVG